MANIQAPFGFASFGNGTAATSNFTQARRKIDYNAAAIYFGDPVTSQADGTVARSAAGTTQIAGIFVGCEYLSVSQGRQVWSRFWPGSDVATGQFATAYIINDPTAQFLVQAGGSATPIGLSNVQANINFGLGTPNTLSGQSGAFADQTTIATATTTLPFRIVDLIQDPPGSNGSDITTSFNYIVVTFNNVDARVLTGI